MLPGHAAAAASAWGSPVYGDPPGWCTRYSDMWTASVVTNDPLVGTNPEKETFYGFHPDPGYDDWYGFFYGDFRGRPNDSSGWIKLLHERYPQHYHWNFADNGWAVHGHVKQQWYVKINTCLVRGPRSTPGSTSASLPIPS